MHCDGVKNVLSLLQMFYIKIERVRFKYWYEVLVYLKRTQNVFLDKQNC